MYSGDRLSAGCNAREMAERRNRPRPKEMLDADQNAISVTPLDELQGMRLEPVEQGEEGGFGKVVVDGEPRPRSGELSGVVRAGKRRDNGGPPAEPAEREEREVVLDEVQDAVHDYLLFKWFEPERTNTWRRIAKWIDEV